MKFFTKDRVAYIDALNEPEAKEDLDVFRKFTVSQYAKFLELEIEKFKRRGGFTIMF